MVIPLHPGGPASYPDPPAWNPRSPKRAILCIPAAPAPRLAGGPLYERFVDDILRALPRGGSWRLSPTAIDDLFVGEDHRAMGPEWVAAGGLAGELTWPEPAEASTRPISTRPIPLRDLRSSI